MAVFVSGVRRHLLFLCASWLVFAGGSRAAGETNIATPPAGAEAVVFITGDQHSAYERTAQLVALIGDIRAENASLPALILLNGDTLEHGNPVALASKGAIDFAMFTALARLAPTYLNLGNHEPEFFDLADTVKRIEATGVKVVGNITDRATGQLFAPATLSLTLGAYDVTLVGLTTDRLATYRVAVQPSLDLADPVVWAKARFPEIFTEQKTLPVILSHAGLVADRAILPLAPDGSLFAGAHDHLRLTHTTGRTVYVHSGSWNEYLTVAWLYHDEEKRAHWDVQQIPVDAAGAGDAALTELIRTTTAQTLTPEARQIIANLPQAIAPAEATAFATRAVRLAAGASAAVIGNTTFGGGLPAGEVSRYAFDACVRFDGALMLAEVTGEQLQHIKARANPGPDTPFEQRTGEYLVGDFPSEIDPAKTYRLVTNDWVVRNQKAYLGDETIAFKTIPKLRLKPLVQQALADASVEPDTAEDETALSADSLYDLSKSLFDQYAPDEFKEQYEFPSREQWADFTAKFQKALENNSLDELAAYGPEAKAALEALQHMPGNEDLASWMEERVDYAEAAKVAATQPAPPLPEKPATPVVPPTPSTTPSEPKPPVTPTLPDAKPVATAGHDVPYYDLWLKRMQARPVPANAARLLPVVRAIFASEGVPPELAWLAESESTFNPSARSPAGARGLFQFMPATAREMGLSTFMPDERTHPEKSARAAARMLRQLHKRFGDWPLALAAYNAGPNRVQRTLKAKDARTFAEIAETLPAETRMYVPKVLATIKVRAGVTLEKIAPPSGE